MTSPNPAAVPHCTEQCWTAVDCPEHRERMNPFGRSAPLDDFVCCDRYHDPEINPRHLWDEHDSARWYHDPDGWDNHEQHCQQCGKQTP